MTLQTGMDYFMNLPVAELIDTIREVAEIVDERKRTGSNH